MVLVRGIIGCCVVVEIDVIECGGEIFEGFGFLGCENCMAGQL